MDTVLNAEKLKELEKFVDLCQANPSILYDPSLSFFREFVERYMPALNFGLLFIFFFSVRDSIMTL